MMQTAYFEGVQPFANERVQVPANGLVMSGQLPLGQSRIPTWKFRANEIDQQPIIYSKGNPHLTSNMSSRCKATM